MHSIEQPTDPAPRILLVSASMGAGHMEVAAELSRRLRATGANARTIDLVLLAAVAGTVLQRTYRLLLARASWLYGLAMSAWRRWPAALQVVTAAGAGPFERSLLRAVEEFQPDLIVSTYNLASQCLGRLTRRGRLRVPVVTFVGDAGAHPYWVQHCRAPGYHVADGGRARPLRGTPRDGHRAGRARSSHVPRPASTPGSASACRSLAPWY